MPDQLNDSTTPSDISLYDPRAAETTGIIDLNKRFKERTADTREERKYKVKGDYYSREDLKSRPFEFSDFQIGSVLLSTPPVDISTYESRQFDIQATPRSGSTYAIKSGTSIIEIQISCVFPTADSINTELREILAYFKANPFNCIRSPYLQQLLFQTSGSVRGVSPSSPDGKQYREVNTEVGTYITELADLLLQELTDKVIGVLRDTYNPSELEQIVASFGPAISNITNGIEQAALGESLEQYIKAQLPVAVHSNFPNALKSNYNAFAIGRVNEEIGTIEVPTDLMDLLRYAITQREDLLNRIKLNKNFSDNPETIPQSSAPIPVAFKDVQFTTIPRESRGIQANFKFYLFNYTSYVPEFHWKQYDGTPTKYAERADWFNYWVDKTLLGAWHKAPFLPVAYSVDVDGAASENQDSPQLSTYEALPKTRGDVPDAIKVPLVRVIDGDTIVVELNGSQEHIRLLAINTPEKGAAKYDEATQSLKELLDGRNVYLAYEKPNEPTRGRYNRILAYVFNEAGTHANLAQLRNGLAVPYREKYSGRFQVGGRNSPAKYIKTNSGVYQLNRDYVKNPGRTIGKVGEESSSDVNFTMYYPLSAETVGAADSRYLFGKLETTGVTPEKKEGVRVNNISVAYERSLAIHPTQLGQYATLQYAGGIRGVTEVELEVVGKGAITQINRVREEIDKAAHRSTQDRSDLHFFAIDNDLINFSGSQYFQILDVQTKAIDSDSVLMKLTLLDQSPKFTARVAGYDAEATKQKIATKSLKKLLRNLDSPANYYRQNKEAILDLMANITVVRTKTLDNKKIADVENFMKISDAFSPANPDVQSYLNRNRGIVELHNRQTEPKDKLRYIHAIMFDLFIEKLDEEDGKVDLAPYTEYLQSPSKEYIAQADIRQDIKVKALSDFESTRRDMHALIDLITNSSSKYIKEYIKILRLNNNPEFDALLNDYDIPVDGLSSDHAAALAKEELREIPSFIKNNSVQGLDPYPDLNLPTYEEILGIAELDFLVANISPDSKRTLKRFVPTYATMKEDPPVGSKYNAFCRSTSDLVEPDFWWFNWSITEDIVDPAITNMLRSGNPAGFYNNGLGEYSISKLNQIPVVLKEIVDGNTIMVEFENAEDIPYMNPGFGVQLTEADRDALRTNSGKGWKIELTNFNAPSYYRRGINGARYVYTDPNSDNYGDAAFSIQSLLREFGLYPVGENNNLEIDALGEMLGTNSHKFDSGILKTHNIEVTKKHLIYLDNYQGRPRKGTFTFSARGGKKGPGVGSVSTTNFNADGELNYTDTEINKDIKYGLDKTLRQGEQYRMAYAFPTVSMKFIFEGKMPINEINGAYIADVTDEERVTNNSRGTDAVDVLYSIGATASVPFKADVYLDAGISDLKVIQREHKIKVATIAISDYSNALTNDRFFIFPQQYDISSRSDLFNILSGDGDENLQNAISEFRPVNLVRGNVTDEYEGMTDLGKAILSKTRGNKHWMRDALITQGTRVTVRMGYTSKVDKLDVRFTGTIAEYARTDSPVLVCQSYDAQLLNPVTETYNPDDTKDTVSQLLQDYFKGTEALGGTTNLGGFLTDPLNYLKMGAHETKRLIANMYGGAYSVEGLLKSFGEIKDVTKPYRFKRSVNRPDNVGDDILTATNYIQDSGASDRSAAELDNRTIDKYLEVQERFKASIDDDTSAGSAMSKYLSAVKAATYQGVSKDIDSFWTGIKQKFGYDEDDLQGELMNCMIPNTSAYAQFLSYIGSWLSHLTTTPKIEGQARSFHAILDQVIKLYPGMMWQFEYFEDEARLFVGRPNSWRAKHASIGEGQKSDFQYEVALSGAREKESALQEQVLESILGTTKLDIPRAIEEISTLMIGASARTGLVGVDHDTSVEDFTSVMQVDEPKLDSSLFGKRKYDNTFIFDSYFSKGQKINLYTYNTEFINSLVHLASMVSDIDPTDFIRAKVRFPENGIWYRLEAYTDLDKNRKRKRIYGVNVDTREYASVQSRTPYSYDKVEAYRIYGSQRNANVLGDMYEILESSIRESLSPEANYLDYLLGDRSEIIPVVTRAMYNCIESTIKGDRYVYINSGVSAERSANAVSTHLRTLMMEDDFYSPINDGSSYMHRMGEILGLRNKISSKQLNLYLDLVGAPYTAGLKSKIFDSVLTQLKIDRSNFSREANNELYEKLLAANAAFLARLVFKILVKRAQENDAGRADFAELRKFSDIKSEYNIQTNPRMGPYQDNHVVTNYNGILQNDIYSTSSHMYNGVVIKYNPTFFSLENFGGDAGKLSSILTGSEGVSAANVLSVAPDEMRIAYIQDPLVSEQADGQRVANSWLAELISKMYQGNIVMRGRSMKPGDLLSIYDDYNGVYGTCLVGDFIDQYSATTGYTTVMVPKLWTEATDEVRHYEMAAVNQGRNMLYGALKIAAVGVGLFNPIAGIAVYAAVRGAEFYVDEFQKDTVDDLTRISSQVRDLRSNVAGFGRFSKEEHYVNVSDTVGPTTATRTDLGGLVIYPLVKRTADGHQPLVSGLTGINSSAWSQIPTTYIGSNIAALRKIRSSTAAWVTSSIFDISEGIRATDLRDRYTSVLKYTGILQGSLSAVADDYPNTFSQSVRGD